MQRLSLSLLATLFTTTAYAFSPACPEFVAQPANELPNPLTSVLDDLAEAIKKKDADHMYVLAVDDIYLGEGIETRLGHYGFHNRRSPMWNELSNALYAGCALLESGEDIWECPGVREDLFFGTGGKRQRKKYSYVVEIARPAGAGGTLLSEPMGDYTDGTLCERKRYRTFESYDNYVLPPLRGIREAKEQKVLTWTFQTYHYDANKAVKTWFKYSHYRMRFKEIDGKWRMTALFRKY